MSGQAILVAWKFWNEISHWVRDLFGFHARIIRGKNNLVETQLLCSTLAVGAFHPFVFVGMSWVKIDVMLNLYMFMGFDMIWPYISCLYRFIQKKQLINHHNHHLNITNIINIRHCDHYLVDGMRWKFLASPLPGVIFFSWASHSIPQVLFHGVTDCTDLASCQH